LWAICWQLCLNPSKCEALLISKKRNPVKASYVQAVHAWRVFHTLEICCSVSWSFHQFCAVMVRSLQITAAKATRSLNYLRHSLWGATHFAKVTA